MVDAASLALLVVGASLFVARARLCGWRSVIRPLHPAVVGLLMCFGAACVAGGGTRRGATEVVQLILIVVVGFCAGSMLRSLDRQVFGRALCAAFFCNLMMSVLQVASPGLGQSITTFVYCAPAQPLWGPDLSEEITAGLFPSHTLYAAFMVFCCPFVIREFAKRFFARLSLTPMLFPEIPITSAICL